MLQDFRALGVVKPSNWCTITVALSHDKMWGGSHLCVHNVCGRVCGVTNCGVTNLSFAGDFCGNFCGRVLQETFA